MTEGSVATGGSQVVNAFYEYFTYVGKNLVLTHLVRVNALEFIDERILSYFFVERCSALEVRNLIMLMSNKRSRLSTIPIYVLKYIDEVISEPIVFLFEDYCAR